MALIVNFIVNFIPVLPMFYLLYKSYQRGILVIIWDLELDIDAILKFDTQLLLYHSVPYLNLLKDTMWPYLFIYPLQLLANALINLIMVDTMSTNNMGIPYKSSERFWNLAG